MLAGVISQNAKRLFQKKNQSEPFNIHTFFKLFFIIFFIVFFIDSRAILGDNRRAIIFNDRRVIFIVEASHSRNTFISLVDIFFYTNCFLFTIWSFEILGNSTCKSHVRVACRIA